MSKELEREQVRLKNKRRSGVALQILSYFTLALIVYPNVNLDNLAYFVDSSHQTQEQKIKARDAISQISIYAGLVGIIFGALGSFVASQDTSDKLKEFEEKLGRLEYRL